MEFGFLFRIFAKIIIQNSSTIQICIEKKNEGKQKKNPLIRRASQQQQGGVLLMFSKHMGICDSNKAEVLAIFLWSQVAFQRLGASLVVESDFYNMIAWMSKQKTIMWRFRLYFNEIRKLSASIDVSFSQLYG